MKCQILTRGLIPGILIRGPVANIELAFDTICDLLDRGVDIRREDGSPFDRIPLDQQPKKAKVIMVPAEKTFKLPRVPELELGGHPDPVGAPGQPGVPASDPIPYEADGKTPPTGSANPDQEIREPVRVDADIPLVEHEDASPDDLDDDEEDEEDAPAPAAPADPSNPYAGMSKNQAKKARRAAAKAAAEAAAKSGTNPQ